MKVQAILDSKGSDVHTIRPDQHVKSAIRLMQLERIGCVVVSTDGRRPEGLFSERDVVKHLNRHGITLLEMRVGRLMTHPVRTCTRSDDLRDVMRLMTMSRIRHVPVVEEGELVGMISIGDVVKNRLDELETETAVLRDYIAGTEARHSI